MKNKNVVLVAGAIFALTLVLILVWVFSVVDLSELLGGGRNGGNDNQNKTSYHKSSDYEYQTIRNQTEALITQLKLGNERVSDEDTEAYLNLNLSSSNEAEKYYAERGVEAINLSIVVDKSGSMSGDKIEYVKKALKILPEYVDEESCVNLVTYSSDVEKVYDSCDKKQQGTYETAVERIVASGSTYLEGGLRKGIDTTNQYDNDNSKALIILSDGLANVGVSTPNGLRDIVEEKVDTDFTISTIGVGTDYDEYLMAEIADAGNGRYYFLSEPEDSKDIFAEEFESVTQVVAENIQVKVKEIGEFEVIDILDYKSNDSYTNFSPNDIYLGKNSNFLFKIATDEGLEPGVHDLLEISISYYDLIEEKEVSLNETIQVEVVDEEVNPLADREVYSSYISAFIAQNRVEVDELLNEVENKDALKLLNETIEEVKQANRRTDGAYDEELEDLEELKSYVKKQGEQDIQESGKGRYFKKLNQQESYNSIQNK
jgi:Ca-activated chloride channel family protein